MSNIAAFKKFKGEAEIIGVILASYTDLELQLMWTAHVIREDFDSVLKVMFRTRGETQRIQVADAMGRHFYHDLGTGSEFEMAIGSMKYCLKIRNQFAHCVWYDDNSGRLAFVNLEEIAIENIRHKDLTTLTRLYVEVPLLQDQLHFFQYSDQLLVWLVGEARYIQKKWKQNPFPKPAQLTQPPLHSP